MKSAHERAAYLRHYPGAAALRRQAADRGRTTPSEDECAVREFCAGARCKRCKRKKAAAYLMQQQQQL